MPGKRAYELRKRADQVEETRRRITEATVELHRTVGPAATQISEIARRAGVQRVTVYNHFPDESALFAACSAHWRALHPAPDPAAWLPLSDPGERLRLGLGELYAWFRETEPMMANILRDADIVPAMRPFVDQGVGGYLEAVRRILGGSIRARVRGRRRARIDAALHVATDFHVWRSLAALGDADAADLSARFVELAATDSPRLLPSPQRATPVPIGHATPVPPIPQ
jgi:AcrR family transcriptional regulator